MKKYKKIISISLLVVMCVLYYYYLSANDTTEKKKKSEKVSTEVEKILSKNLDDIYPATPREVVILYSKILKCYYSGKCSDEEITELAMQSRKLFDDELLSKNPTDEYLEDLKAEIKQYKEEGKKISTYIIAKSGEIEYKTFQSHYYAMVDSAYYLKGEGNTSRTLETYTLRKDSNGRWKIVFWNLTKTSDEE